jgi:hypothetical protein
VYRWIGGFLVMAALLGAGIGCGGGGDETSSDVTKAQFVKKADSVCADFKSQRLAAAEKSYNQKARQGPETPAFEAELKELAEELLTSEILPLIKQQQEELESLDVPAADEEKIDAMLANLGKATGELEQEGLAGLVAGSMFDAFESETEKYGWSCPVVR